MGDYKITFHTHRNPELIVYTKSRFTNARQWIEKLMTGLELEKKS